MILLSRAEEIVLLAVFKLKGSAYGVTIRDQIYNDIGQYWSFGAIYKTLTHGLPSRGVMDPSKHDESEW